MINFDGLNAQQKDAVFNFKGPTMILAGAGTGKTRVVTMRIAYMLQNGIAAQNIAAMTFTNKAANEMRERIRELVGPKQAARLNISTFHSFCLSILKQATDLCGLHPRFSLLGPSDQLELVKKSLAERGWTGLFKAEQLLYQIGICKNWLISPNHLRKGKFSIKDIEDPHTLAEVYDLYERQLQLNRAIDFDDCILKVVNLLRNNAEFKIKVQSKFKYLLVDEFQDTNASQFAILEEVAKNGQICVVGDDDQSIYSWRGAMYETLERFEKTFTNTRVIKLEQNYRCSNVILEAANAVIKNNVQRKDKTLWSDSKVQQPITIASFEDAVEEARWVAESCLSMLGAGKQLKDIAILYRTNAQAKLIEMALRECSLFYKTFGGQSFFERQEVKDFLSYLRLVTNHSDHMALWRVINVPTRGIGLKTQEKIEQISRNTKISPFEVIASRQHFSHFSGQSFEKVSLFSDTIKKLSLLPLDTPQDLQALGEAIIKEFKLLDYIKDTSKNVLSKQRKMENLRSLPTWLKKSGEDQIKNNGSFCAQKLIDFICLNEAPSTEDDDQEAQNHISLMTIHSAKGLEFSTVFIVGVEEDCLPHKNSQENLNSLCEERRLFYVALTRAKHHCLLSYAQMRQTGFQKESRKMSRFISEMPKDPSIVSQKNQSDRKNTEQERKQNTVSKLSLIRKNLLKGSWD